MTEKVEVLDWIFNWFIPRNEGQELDLEKNFFEMGLIDSFGVIELIEELEEEFEITFDQLDFQDRRFSSINGLAIIVSTKINS